MDIDVLRIRRAEESTARLREEEPPLGLSPREAICPLCVLAFIAGSCGICRSCLDDAIGRLD